MRGFDTPFGVHVCQILAHTGPRGPARPAPVHTAVFKHESNACFANSVGCSDRHENDTRSQHAPPKSSSGDKLTPFFRPRAQSVNQTPNSLLFILVQHPRPHMIRKEPGEGRSRKSRPDPPRTSEAMVGAGNPSNQMPLRRGMVSKHSVRAVSHQRAGCGVCHRQADG